MRIVGGPLVPKQASSLEYKGPIAIIRLVVRALTSRKDSFEDPYKDLATIIRKLQGTDVALPTLYELSKGKG